MAMKTKLLVISILMLIFTAFSNAVNDNHHQQQITAIDYAVMVFAALLPLLFGLKGRISRAGGAFMFLCYIGYTVYLLKMQII